MISETGILRQKGFQWKCQKKTKIWQQNLHSFHEKLNFGILKQKHHEKYEKDCAVGTKKENMRQQYQMSSMKAFESNMGVGEVIKWYYELSARKCEKCESFFWTPLTSLALKPIDARNSYRQTTQAIRADFWRCWTISLDRSVDFFRTWLSKITRRSRQAVASEN